MIDSHSSLFVNCCLNNNARKNTLTESFKYPWNQLPQNPLLVTQHNQSYNNHDYN